MRLIKVFAEPSYLLGRFHAVRRAYGLLRAGGQAIGPRSSEVRLFDLPVSSNSSRQGRHFDIAQFVRKARQMGTSCIV